MDTKIIQFSAGNGPNECAWVVAQVLKLFIKEVEKENYKSYIIAKTSGALERTIRSVIVQIKGTELDKFIDQWLGSILWVGNSPYRPNYKRKNWFIGCKEIAQRNYEEFNEQSIHFQAIRSSGPGGQHANKVSSAVRATHMVTGLQVLVSDSRSQHQNKTLALQRLKGKFIEYQMEQMRFQNQEDWEEKSQIQRGNPIKVFKGNTIAPKVKKDKYNRNVHKAQWKQDLKNYEY